ncbi:MAG: hypothetical protein Q7U28_08085 [Aquabacterium sp.]|nr:hypothetical protein [Aquabacterium sp.]
MNCCNDFGHCTRGENCPARIAPLSAPECHSKPCQPPALTPRTWDQFAHQVCVVAVYGASTGIALGTLSWLWDRFGDDVQRLYWATLALWF